MWFEVLTSFWQLEGFALSHYRWRMLKMIRLVIVLIFRYFKLERKDVPKKDWGNVCILSFNEKFLQLRSPLCDFLIKIFVNLGSSYQQNFHLQVNVKHRTVKMFNKILFCHIQVKEVVLVLTFIISWVSCTNGRIFSCVCYHILMSGL